MKSSYERVKPLISEERGANRVRYNIKRKKLSIDFSKKNKGAWFWLSFPFYFDSPEILKMFFIIRGMVSEK